MRFLVLAIVLAIPIGDLWLTARLARWSGVPLWVFLVGSLLAGLLLLRNERIEFRARTVAALHGEQSVMRGFLDSGRRVLAALLLMIPGILTDLIALMLLALPLNVGRALAPMQAGTSGSRRAGDALDGEFRRIE